MPSERVCFVCFDPAEVCITIEPMSHEKSITYYLCHVHLDSLTVRLATNREANLRNVDKRSAARSRARAE